ncbi:MAG TPA: LysM peptidoglycan-binding domain-containing protein, partial [Acidimicrobiales bacterium]|nr:LysM peptidoglycan-binding domain-containing protein [Acidimicrobiales bacterium]
MTSATTSMAVARWMRGLGAAAALVVLVVAVPWALLAWGHWPLTGLPSADQLRDLPGAVASDSAIIGAFTVALWVAWIVFVGCLVAEIAAEARGREASRLVAVGPVQKLARHLVATVAMTVGWLGPLAGSSLLSPPARTAAAASPAPSAAAAPATRLVSATTKQAPAMTASAGPRTSVPGPEAPAPDPVTVVVRPGDSPWALAQEHLGEGARWTEIWELNRGVPQPDGRSWDSPETIMPGWQFALPAGAAAAGVLGPGQVMVQPDDNPWSLAEIHLGDGKRWRELFDANRGRVQPDGDAWVTESLVQPGWVLDLPSASASAPAPLPAPAPAPPPVEAPVAEAPPAPPSPAEAPAPLPAPVPAPPPVEAPVAEVPPAPSPPSPPTTVAEPQPDPRPDPGAVPVPSPRTAPTNSVSEPEPAA